MGGGVWANERVKRGCTGREKEGKGRIRREEGERGRERMLVVGCILMAMKDSWGVMLIKKKFIQFDM